LRICPVWTVLPAKGSWELNLKFCMALSQLSHMRVCKERNSKVKISCINLFPLCNIHATVQHQKSITNTNIDDEEAVDCCTILPHLFQIPFKHLFMLYAYNSGNWIWQCVVNYCEDGFYQALYFLSADVI
jgi:hypothetical protein